MNPTIKTWVNTGAPEKYAVPAPKVIICPVMNNKPVIIV
jgi:hypothetical protein